MEPRPGLGLGPRVALEMERWWGGLDLRLMRV